MRSEVTLKGLGKRFAARLLGAICVLAICGITSGVVRGQDTAPSPPPPDRGFERMGRGPMPPDAMEFVGFQAGLGEKTVTGAPFSATFTTESKQTLGDGNQIQHSSTGSIARDSQGRTRRDMTIPAFGPLAESGKPAPHVAAVNDPVANTRFLLDTDNKIARKMAGPADAREFERKPREGAGAKTADSETVTTSLGTQTIGGVSAEGTRYTRTIPAGQIGNAKPIVIVTERWYSPDLQMVVMTKRTDPRMGETTFQMTNIQRQEPAASLFQVPADFTVKQEGARGARRAGNMPAPPAEQ